MPDIFDASQQSASTDSSTVQDQDMVEDDLESSRKPDVEEAPLINKARKFVDKVEEKLHPLDAVDRYSQIMRESQPSRNPFDAFAAKPLTVYAFDSQLDNEQVLLLLRKHPITQVGKIIVIFIMLLLPFIFPRIDFYTNIPARFRTASLILWYLVTAGTALETFLSWFYNAYIVTDERIIDIDFLSLIYKNISAAKIENIEDITATTGGALQSVVNFGTVTVQTAAAQAEFEFEDVPQPNKVTQFLNEMILQEEQEKIEGRVR